MNTLRREDDGAVVTLFLHRPERLNAWTVEMALELFGALVELGRDPAVRAVVITGSGRAFCAGADLGAGGDTFAGVNRWEDAAHLERQCQPWTYPKPVIAAINGPAVGIGATLPLQWDVRLMAQSARIGFVFVRRGICPEAGSTWLLPRLVGASAAAELCLTGRLVGAEEALRLGLVSRVLPDAELLPAARALAREIAEHTSPRAVAATKRLLWEHLAVPSPEPAKDHEDRVFRWLGQQPDAAEGVTAFLEKRAPRWPDFTTLPDEPFRR